MISEMIGWYKVCGKYRVCSRILTPQWHSEHRIALSSSYLRNPFGTHSPLLTSCKCRSTSNPAQPEKEVNVGQPIILNNKGMSVVNEGHSIIMNIRNVH